MYVSPVARSWRHKKGTTRIIMIMIIQMIHSQKLPLQRILTIRWSYSMIRPLSFTFVQDEMVLCRWKRSAFKSGHSSLRYYLVTSLYCPKSSFLRMTSCRGIITLLWNGTLNFNLIVIAMFRECTQWMVMERAFTQCLVATLEYASFYLLRFKPIGC